MKKTIGKPENWQDFESLCKVLWGEIWNCPEIKKNGRNGQLQQGVDIYGIPETETRYYGIQCKGKDDYTKSKLTEKEISAEIEMARLFKPSLKKFYFATTANKDSKIEEYVRIQDEESRKKGDFEIHLFSWEDIVDLIDEHKRTHDWFVNKIGHKTRHSIKVTFSNGESHLIFKPVLVKNHITYALQETVMNNRSFIPKPSLDNSSPNLEVLFEPQPIRYYMIGESYNKSSCVFSILIENDGTVPIENYKMHLSFNGADITVDTVNKRRKFLDVNQYSYNTIMFEDSNDCEFEPKQQILVQTDIVSTDKICLRPNIEASQDIIIQYDFVAKDYNKKGELTIRLETSVVEENQTIESTIPKDNETRLENYIK